MTAKKALPVTVQLLLAFVVLSFLTTFGVLSWRANGAMSDAVFRPLASLLCSSGSRLETAYGQTPVRQTTRPNDRRTHSVARLGSAECVSASGARQSVSGGAFLTLVYLVCAAPWAVLLLWTRTRMRRRRP